MAGDGYPLGDLVRRGHRPGGEVLPISGLIIGLGFPVFRIKDLECGGRFQTGKGAPAGDERRRP